MRFIAVFSTLYFVGGVGLEPTRPLGSGFTGRRANQIAQSTQNFRWFTRVPTSQWATTFALQGYLLLRFQMLAHCHINCFGSVLFLAWFQHSYKFIGVTGFEPMTLCSQGKCSTRLSYTPVKNYLNGFRQILNYLQHNLSLTSLSPGGFEPTVSARLSSGPTASIGWGQRISI